MDKASKTYKHREAWLRYEAQKALDIQDACNLSGVVHSFSEFFSGACERFEWNTAEKNSHPIAVLYASKIASLTNSETLTEFSHAYEWAKLLIEHKCDNFSHVKGI